MNRKSLLTLLSLLLLTFHSAYSFVDNKVLSPIPIPDYILGGSSVKMSLNSSWYFSSNPSLGFEKKGIEFFQTWKEVDVPSEWYMHGDSVKGNLSAAYVKYFDIPDSWLKQRVFVRFGAVNPECVVFVNGNKIGTHIGGMMQFEYELTKYMKKGKNMLALYIKLNSSFEEIGHISHYARHQVGGILRFVTLYTVPKSFISDIDYKYEISSNLAKIDIDFGITVKKNMQNKNLSLDLSLYYQGVECDTLGEKCFSTLITNIKSNNKIEVHNNITFPYLWHPESPHLYRVVCKLFSGKKLIEVVSKKIGFRKIKINGNKVYFNNVPILLKGIAAHDITAFNGRALNDSVQILRDVISFKNANCNYIRTAHYPKDSYFMDLCDYYGILVENEAPVCWFWNKTPDSNLSDIIIRNFYALVMRDKLHPSVFCWSIANESYWSEPFRKCYKYAKKVTPDIPVKFSHSEYFGIIEDVDLGSRHYPGWKGLIKYSNYYRPIVFDEAIHINTYNFSEYFSDPGLRNIWGKFLNYAVNQVENSASILGLGVWSGIDETFFPYKRKPIGYGPWGVLDVFRREKPEYWHLKMAYSPIKLISKTFHIDGNNAYVVVLNKYVQTDLNQLKIMYHTKSQNGYLDVSGKPGSIVPLAIPYQSLDDTISLSFIDYGNREVFRCKVPKYKREKVMPQMQSGGIVPNIYTNNDSIVLSLNQLTYIISKNSGQIKSIRKGKSVLVENSPLLYLVPHSKQNEVNDFVPEATVNTDSIFQIGLLENWKCKKVQLKQNSSCVNIYVTGKFDSIPVKLTYQFNGTGQVRIDYTLNLKNMNTDSIRQIGIGLKLPYTFQKLSWDREGIWTCYPSDHIGRLKGSTQAFSKYNFLDVIGKRLEPTWSYSLDNSKYGTVDFRSTKYNIYEAVFSDISGNNHIKIQSNGLQDIRAWYNDYNINFLVANYSNGGNEHYLNYDSDRIKIYQEEMLLDGGDFRGWIQMQF